ncbi:hypothetical protein D9613_006470 [Agrocybe pediades]|uniref:F-box domain-containing protein n=1 Tax=Agrocybe pediades TaxID=84607 RepID=A0A8H4QHG2_9AGAR|nr:hypothetical protein D9613_006470 [Agrocybe pediades]
MAPSAAVLLAPEVVHEILQWVDNTQALLSCRLVSPIFRDTAAVFAFRSVVVKKSKSLADPGAKLTFEELVKRLDLYRHVRKISFDFRGVQLRTSLSSSGEGETVEHIEEENAATEEVLKEVVLLASFPKMKPGSIMLRTIHFQDCLLRRLASLQVEHHLVINSLYLFGVIPERHNALKTAGLQSLFSQLSAVSIRVYPGMLAKPYFHSWESLWESFAAFSQVLSLLLDSSKNLETITYSGDKDAECVNARWSSWKDLHFPKLKHLRFQVTSSLCHESTTIPSDFLSRHGATLERIEMDHCFMTNETVGTWVGLFSRMQAELDNLVEFTFHPPLGMDRDDDPQCPDHYHGYGWFDSSQQDGMGFSTASWDGMLFDYEEEIEEEMETLQALHATTKERRGRLYHLGANNGISGFQGQGKEDSENSEEEGVEEVEDDERDD